MTSLQTIIKEISHLNQEELELLLREVIQRIDQQKKVEAILDEYIGVGEDVWQTDAQEYVNELRKEEEE
jgi:hypothetical protein